MQVPEEESVPRRNYISQAQPTNLSVCKYTFVAFGWLCLLLLVGLVSCIWLALFPAFGWPSGLPGCKTRMDPRRILTSSQAQPACPTVCRYVILAFGLHLGFPGPSIFKGDLHWTYCNRAFQLGGHLQSRARRI